MIMIVPLVCITSLAVLGLSAVIWTWRRIQSVRNDSSDLADAAEGNEELYQEEIRRIAA